MSRHIVHITNGSETQVKIEISATASGFEVDTWTAVHGNGVARHLGVHDTREYAVAAAKTEAARVAAAFLTGVAP